MEHAVESNAPPPAAAPWHCWLMVLGATSIAVGTLWDISWHSTVGRDTFWTPAHVAIYLGGVIAGVCGGWLALRATFGGGEERARSVSILGCRAPVGAWVSIWGAVAMITAAPFDDWWHNAYGLDVEILSPPHCVLALGIWAVLVGPLLLLAREQNRSGSAERGSGAGLFIYAAGVWLAMGVTVFTERSLPNCQRAALFYKLSCAWYPFSLLAVARASRLPFAATRMALVYMGLILLMMWILPLFPAQPLLAPIYNPVDRMVPPAFPLLLCIPALGVDLIERWLGPGGGRSRDWLQAALSGAAFLGLFLPAQWLFSGFLLTEAADNWLFAGTHWVPYSESPGDWLHRFWHQNSDPLTLGQCSIALALAMVSARVGLWWGTWMARVKR